MTAPIQLYHVVNGALKRYGREDAPTPPPPPPPVAARFPGDPNPRRTGRMWLGAGVGRNDPVTARHETPTGVKLAIRRRFYNSLVDGVVNYADITPPNGAFFKAVREDHAAGRLPCVSFKLHGWATAASGGHDARMDAIIAELESYAKPTWPILNHEPENDSGRAADWRAMQRRFRQRMNAYYAAHPGQPRRISFGSCLMTYTFNPVSGRNPEDWWAGAGVHDWVGNDHYTEPNQAIDRPNPWGYFVTWCNTKGVPYTLPEFGLRRSDVTAAAKLQAFYNRMLDGTHDCLALMYFDSDANSKPDPNNPAEVGWALADGNGLLSKFHQLMKDPRSLHLSDLGY